MPYHHADQLNDQIKRRCDCGGEPEMLIDFVEDYIVRCKKCHKSTYAYIAPEDAIEHWDELWDEEDDSRPPLDLLIDDLEKNLSGRVLYMAIEERGAVQEVPQSIDCYRLVIVMSDHLVHVEHEEHGEDGAISFDRIASFSDSYYSLRIDAPPDGSFEFDRVLYAEDGEVEGLKYRFGDRYLFIFTCEYNLIVTKSKIDLSEL